VLCRAGWNVTGSPQPRAHRLADQEQTADEQFALIGELTRYLQKTPVEIPGSADLQSIDTGVLYVPERLVEQRMLVSAINLTYQVVIDTQPR
jgi:hypothetical protein